MSLSVPAEQIHLAHPKYRADIDGLRAIAVLSVVGFHAFPEWIKGGFIGVDIFFVISGFLISSIILGSLQKGMFSFAEFYARRIKRIFPALLVMMAICIIFGWFALLGDEYKQLGKHITAGAGFVSNFFFWQETGYFDNTAETKPLLHLWSLGIEEQFYLIWPLLLYLSWRWRLNFMIIAVGIAAISFSVNVDIHFSDRSQDFYSPSTRFWELMLGSILAYLTLQKINLIDNQMPVVRSSQEKICTNSKSVVGALLIIGGGLQLTKDSFFPGWWALLPTTGAYLIISAGPYAWLNQKILSHRIMVWLGLISYPVYLWHWPLLSFAQIMGNKTPSISIRLAAIVLAILLAWLTYLLIERPIRLGKHSGTKVFFLVTLMAMLAGMGYGTYANDGFKDRSKILSLQKQADGYKLLRNLDGWTHCPNANSGCWIVHPAQAPVVALIGDSHALSLASGLADFYGRRNENIILNYSPGCMPFFDKGLDGEAVFAQPHTACDGSIINRSLNEAITSLSIRTVILTSYAMMHIKEGINAPVMTSTQYFEDTHIAEEKIKTAVFKNALEYTLERLVNSGKRVIYIVDTPELYFNPMECISLRPIPLSESGPRTLCAIDKKAFLERSADFHRLILEAHATFPTVKFINAYEYLCDKELCYALIDGKLLYADRDHLTSAGSRYLVDKMAKELLE